MEVLLIMSKYINMSDVYFKQLVETVKKLIENVKDLQDRVLWLEEHIKYVEGRKWLD